MLHIAFASHRGCWDTLFRHVPFSQGTGCRSTFSRDHKSLCPISLPLCRSTFERKIRGTAWSFPKWIKSWPMNRPQAQEKREEGEEDGRDFNNRRKREREIEALIGVFKRSDLLVSLRVKSLLNFDFKKRRWKFGKNICRLARQSRVGSSRFFLCARNWPIWKSRARLILSPDKQLYRSFDKNWFWLRARRKWQSTRTRTKSFWQARCSTCFSLYPFFWSKVKKWYSCVQKNIASTKYVLYHIFASEIFLKL